MNTVTLRGFIVGLIDFAIQQAKACFFAVFILAVLMVTKYFPIPYIPRYDFVLLMCLLMQVAMVWWLRMETVDELKVICLFHVLGTTMEIFKVAHGSWSYPEDSFVRIAGVPLYGGFMYASVASYITQSWRNMRLSIENFPPGFINYIVGALIYFNFFTHHYIMDFRYWIIGLILVVYARTWVRFEVMHFRLQMPLVVSFVLVGFFIWLAENIATFLGAWQYPNQAHQWNLVHPGKVTSWCLLFIVSFIIVAQLKRIKGKRSGLEIF